MDALMRLLRENMEKILLYQKMLLSVNHALYPRIPFEPAHNCIMAVQETNENQRTKFQKAHIELCF